MSAEVAGAVALSPQTGKGQKPRHIAIIMDGNGRWARARGLPRTEGHRHGLEALKNTVRAAVSLEIDYLTVFSFSSENWTRPAEEIDFLLKLMHRFVKNDLAELHKNNVRVRMIGRRDNLSPEIIKLIIEAESLTAANTGLTLVIAFNYGARDEMVRAAEKLAEAIARGEVQLEKGRGEALLSGYLDTAGMPDPDLIIRTSGEQRLSNFLLWQAAYTEFVFLDCYWPDFTRADLEAAIGVFAERHRRYGGLG